MCSPRCEVSACHRLFCLSARDRASTPLLYSSMSTQTIGYTNLAQEPNSKLDRDSQTQTQSWEPKESSLLPLCSSHLCRTSSTGCTHTPTCTKCSVTQGGNSKRQSEQRFTYQRKARLLQLCLQGAALTCISQFNQLLGFIGKSLSSQAPTQS